MADKCTWTFLGKGSQIRESVEVALLDEDSRSIFWFHLDIDTLLSLLNGSSMHARSLVDIETPDAILDHAREVLGDKFDADVFFEREIMVRPR